MSDLTNHDVCITNFFMSSMDEENCSATMVVAEPMSHESDISDINQEPSSGLNGEKFADFSAPATESVTSFHDGQEVQLDDGSTALLYHNLKDALGNCNLVIQEIHLDNGTTAYLCQPKSSTVTSLLDSASTDSDTILQLQVPEIPSGDERHCTKMYMCDHVGCNKVYTTAHHLKVHKRTHTGEKPYVCEWANCNKVFTTSYSLKSHYRVHTGEKPYSCPDASCTKAFKTAGDLQKHIRTHTGERPFKCPFEGCGKAFTTSNICKVHIRTHTGERPHKCPYSECAKSFTNITNYRNHLRIHTGEKPYVCSVKNCGKQFTEYSSLYKHQVVHCIRKPHMCRYCGKLYRQSNALSLHLQKIHPNCTDRPEANPTKKQKPVPCDTVEKEVLVENSPAPPQPVSLSVVVEPLEGLPASSHTSVSKMRSSLTPSHRSQPTSLNLDRSPLRSAAVSDDEHTREVATSSSGVLDFSTNSSSKQIEAAFIEKQPAYLAEKIAGSKNTGDETALLSTSTSSATGIVPLATFVVNGSKYILRVVDDLSESDEKDKNSELLAETSSDGIVTLNFCDDTGQANELAPDARSQSDAVVDSESFFVTNKSNCKKIDQATIATSAPTTTTEPSCSDSSFAHSFIVRTSSSDAAGSSQDASRLHSFGPSRHSPFPTLLKKRVVVTLPVKSGKASRFSSKSVSVPGNNDL